MPLDPRGLANYRNGIRAGIRGLWSGVLDYYQFVEHMDIVVRNGLARAWRDGAADCGITPEEMTDEERLELAQAVFNELDFVDRLATEIEAGSKANGGELAPLLVRAELWIRRYQDVASRARVLACGDQKLMWRLGLTEKHCATCLKLAGLIKRASVWKAAGIQPRNPPNNRLECGGWLCDCTLEATKLHATPGPLPACP